jgi:hypothetical protein
MVMRTQGERDTENKKMQISLYVLKATNVHPNGSGNKELFCFCVKCKLFQRELFAFLRGSESLRINRSFVSRKFEVFGETSQIF